MIEKINNDRKKEIVELAESISDIFCNKNNTAIDLNKILDHDKIRLIEDDFGNDFEGRSEIIADQFVIFYNTKITETRKRFTIAHELGHCEIQEHRNYLLYEKQPFDCKINFFKESTIPEQEANIFASALLLPSITVTPLLENTFPSIDLFQNIADKMETSLTSTMIRCLDLSPYPYGVLYLKDNKVQWSFFNEWMKELSLSYVPNNSEIPDYSSLRKKKLTQQKIITGYCKAISWFPKSFNKSQLKEEAYNFGANNNEQLLVLALEED